MKKILFAGVMLVCSVGVANRKGHEKMAVQICVRSAVDSLNEASSNLEKATDHLNQSLATIK